MSSSSATGSGAIRPGRACFGRRGAEANSADSAPRHAAPSRPATGAAVHGRAAPARATPRADQPHLRLVGTEHEPQTGEVRAVPGGTPLSGATDPRWVLAVRTAEQLEGTLLPPEKRQNLIRLGRVMGLNPFDCNLVIAIVQDQARRGHAAEYCAAASEQQLQMVPVPRHASILARLRQRPGLIVGGIIVAMLLIEFSLLRWWF